MFSAAAMTPDTLERVPVETAIIDRVQRSGAALIFDVNYRPGLWGSRNSTDVRTLLSEPHRVIVNDAGVGAGDAFAAGYLSAHLAGINSEQRLNRGHERAVLVLQSPADLPSHLA